VEKVNAKKKDLTLITSEDIARAGIEAGAIEIYKP